MTIRRLLLDFPRGGITVMALSCALWGQAVTSQPAREGLRPPGDARAGSLPAGISERCTSAPASRWLPGDAGYRPDGFYGLREDEWLASVAGIERAPDGSLWVFDSQNARVVRISADLSEAREIAGAGPGPGELAYVPGMMLESMGKDWLTASDSLVYVFDVRALSVFGLDGEFRRYVPGFRPGDMSALRIHAIHHARGGLLYSVDTGRGPTAADASREMETWAIRGDARERLFSYPVPPIPRVPMGTFSPPGQSDPLWAASHRCVFVSEGERPWLITLELETRRLDSLPLPDVPPPEISDEIRKDMRSILRMSGVDGDGLEPTSLKHWQAMTVDPDGFMWLLPVAEAQAEGPGEPLTIFVADPSTKEVVSVAVPGFPRVFGAPGEYYAVEEDPSLEVPVIRRFTRARTIE